MENALRACCKGIKIGKILIHGEGNSGRQVRGGNCVPSSTYTQVSRRIFYLATGLIVLILIDSILLQLIYQKLPADISSRHVLLLDPILASGLD